MTNSQSPAGDEQRADCVGAPLPVVDLMVRSYVITGEMIMDINATLRRLREIVNENRLASDLHEAATLGNEMADLFEGLDEWLTRGGHLPTDWLAPRVERALEG